MSNKVKIAIADDEVLFRKGICFLLAREENFDILFDANNGQELLDNLNKENLPDVILMDLKMPLLNGVETTKIIHQEHPFIKVIALTSYSGSSFISNMIAIGASSYLLKNTTPTIVVHTINEVFKKGFFYDDKVLQIINSKIPHEKEVQIKFDLDQKLLSKREFETLELICAQFSTNEIADKLYISPRTVEGHRKKLLKKTGSKNIAGLVIYGIQAKIIQIAFDL